MARADELLLLFIKIHQAPQVGADPGKGQVALVRNVQDDYRGGAEQQIFSGI